jgi:hypothetical protein
MRQKQLWRRKRRMVVTALVSSIPKYIRDNPKDTQPTTKNLYW